MQSLGICLLLICTFLIDSNNGQANFDSNDLDWNVRPTDNFFNFANGRWMNRTIVPPSQTEWGSLYSISFQNSNRLKDILDDLTNNGTSETPHPVGSPRRKVADLYLAGLDEETIERLNIEPLRETFVQLENVNTYQELILFLLNWYKKTNQGLIFEFDVYPDERNTSINMAVWKQSGIELPERDYYFRNDPVSKNIRLHYINYIDRLLNLTNHVLNKTTNLIDAENVLTLETQVAVSHRTPYELRDPDKNYHKFTVDELDRMMPNLGWHRILSILTIKNTTVIVSQPDYYRLLDNLLPSQSLEIWKNKIRFTIIHKMANYLSKDFVKARFYMFEYTLYGRLEAKSRWMKIIDDINEYAGELIGQLYIYRYSSAGAKQRTLNLANHLIETYHQRILRNEWMSDSTKDDALFKLSKIRKKLAYPSQWKSYDHVFINRWSYFDSMLSIFDYSFRKKIKDLNKLVDRNEWVFPPQTANAFYNPLFNEIVVPAGILQEPFFQFNADDAINYGAIGCMVAHELTHGFDDQGRKYDADGNLRSWWTPKDVNGFNSRTKLLVEQFNNYTILNTTVNGFLTLGENIADLAGVEISYEAFLQTEQAKAGILIDGFTPNQRFFLSFARILRIKTTDAKLLSDIKINPHAPAIFRLNGPLSDMKGFYETFNVTKNDKMFREPSARPLIW